MRLVRFLKNTDDSYRTAQDVSSIGDYVPKRDIVELLEKLHDTGARQDLGKIMRILEREIEEI